MEEIKFCTGGGCTAKLGAGALKRVLERLPKREDPDLLVGYNGSDDAAVQHGVSARTCAKRAARVRRADGFLWLGL